MEWSGRDVTKAKIIATITTVPMYVTKSDDKSTITYPPETLNIIEIIGTKTGMIYIINKWYKPGVPQIIHENLVDKIEILSN